MKKCYGNDNPYMIRTGHRKQSNSLNPKEDSRRRRIITTSSGFDKWKRYDSGRGGDICSDSSRKMMKPTRNNNRPNSCGRDDGDSTHFPACCSISLCPSCRSLQCKVKGLGECMTMNFNNPTGSMERTQRSNLKAFPASCGSSRFPIDSFLPTDPSKYMPSKCLPPNFTRYTSPPHRTQHTSRYSPSSKGIQNCPSKNPAADTPRRSSCSNRPTSSNMCPPPRREYGCDISNFSPSKVSKKCPQYSTSPGRNPRDTLYVDDNNCFPKMCSSVSCIPSVNSDSPSDLEDVNAHAAMSRGNRIPNIDILPPSPMVRGRQKHCMSQTRCLLTHFFSIIRCVVFFTFGFLALTVLQGVSDVFQLVLILLITQIIYIIIFKHRTFYHVQ